MFRPDAEALERGKQTIKDILAKISARTIREDDIGERQLAYQIAKQDRGHYTLYEIETDPQKVQELKQAVALLPDVLKYFIVRKEAR